MPSPRGPKDGVGDVMALADRTRRDGAGGRRRLPLIPESRLAYRVLLGGMNPTPKPNDKFIAGTCNKR